MKKFSPTLCIGSVVIVCIAFFVYVYFALLRNHSLFRPNWVFFTTVVFLIAISSLLPVNPLRKLKFTEMIKSIFSFLPFILAAIIFFIQSIETMQSINNISVTPINYAYIAGSIIMLLVSILPLSLSIYLSHNVESKKLATGFYRAFLFFMLFYLCIIISLFGGIISYYTYVPGPI